MSDLFTTTDPARECAEEIVKFYWGEAQAAKKDREEILEIIRRHMTPAAPNPPDHLALFDPSGAILAERDALKAALTRIAEIGWAKSCAHSAALDMVDIARAALNK